VNVGEKKATAFELSLFRYVALSFCRSFASGVKYVGPTMDYFVAFLNSSC